MAYDSSKDKLIEEVKTSNEEYRVCIFQYGEGEKKLCIQKWTEFKDRVSGEDVKTWGNKIGRMIKPDAEEVLKLYQDMITKL